MEKKHMPVAISRLGEGVEGSREPQNMRAIQWLLRQPGGPITVVTPLKNFASDSIKALIKQHGVTHRTWRGLLTQGLRGRVLFAWPDRKHLNDLWGIDADALVVIEWNIEETQEWIEDNQPTLLLHDGTKPYVPDEVETTPAEPLPNGIDRILDYVAKMAAGYSSGLKWNEKDKLKADMMNCPDRWKPVTVEQVRARCKELGMQPKDVNTIAELLQRRKDGHSFRVGSSYRNFHF